MNKIHLRLLLVGLPLAFTMLLTGCDRPGGRVSAAITEQYLAASPARIDLAKALPGDWDRVCVFDPYSTNAHVAQALGFAWDMEARSSIASDDHIALLVFAQGETVFSYAEHPRDEGDFASLNQHCVQRSQAVFVEHTSSVGVRVLKPAINQATESKS